MSSFETKMKKLADGIDEKKYYSPDEIVSLGVILNTKFEPSRSRVYRLIQRGQLPARNMGVDDVQPRWFVLGKDLKNFVESKIIKV